MQKQILLEKLKNYKEYILLAIATIIFDFVLAGAITIETLSFFFILIILRKACNFLFKTTLIFSSILTFLFLPIRLCYGELSFLMIVSTYYTNVAESFGFFKSIHWTAYLASLFFLIFSYVLISKNFKPVKTKVIYTLIAVILIISVIRPIVIYYASYKSAILENQIRYGPLRFTTKLYKHYTEVIKEDLYIKETLEKEETWLIKSKQTLQDLQIVVIGESVRRDAMHCYGFNIENTPFASNSNAIIFNNVISIASGTTSSLLRTICENTKDGNHNYNINNNIITLAKKAEMHTHWISNQGFIGVKDSPLAIIGRYSDQPKFLQPGHHRSHIEKKDVSLLPWIKEAIFDYNGNKKQLIVIHLIGSHNPFQEKTDGQYENYFINESISCYIQSIKNTDKLLNTIYDYALASEKSFSMVYFADHGLELYKNTLLRHSPKVKQSFEIPLIIWGTDIKERKRIETNRNLKDFMILFQELSDIQTENIENKYRFISEEKYFEDLVITNDNKTEKYSSLPDNPLRIE